MEKILLKKDGKILCNGKNIGSVVRFLGRYVELEEGYGLNSFFKMLDIYKELIEIHEVLNSLIEIVEKQSMVVNAELDSLLFYKTVEMKGFPGKPSINIYSSLKGVKTLEVKDLKFFHLETLLDCELKLGDLNHIVFGDKEDVLSFETSYNLFELVEGIAWQLSFNFNPLHCSIRR
jgi:hypothetical protein